MGTPVRGCGTTTNCPRPSAVVSAAPSRRDAERKRSCRSPRAKRGEPAIQSPRPPTWPPGCRSVTTRPTSPLYAVSTATVTSVLIAPRASATVSRCSIVPTTIASACAGEGALAHADERGRAGARRRQRERSGHDQVSGFDAHVLSASPRALLRRALCRCATRVPRGYGAAWPQAIRHVARRVRIRRVDRQADGCRSRQLADGGHCGCEERGDARGRGERSISAARRSTRARRARAPRACGTSRRARRGSGSSRDRRAGGRPAPRACDRPQVRCAPSTARRRIARVERRDRAPRRTRSMRRARRVGARLGRELGRRRRAAHERHRDRRTAG